MKLREDGARDLTACTVPETKQLTLEEMDLVFGSSGVAAADRERMALINSELGLDRRAGVVDRSSDEHVAEVNEKSLDEKTV